MNESKNRIEDIAFLLDQIGLAWWIEIVTYQPHCIYYFGPFATSKEAISFQDGYIEDIAKEEPQELSLTLRRIKPKELTIFEDDWTESDESQIALASSCLTQSQLR